MKNHFPLLRRLAKAKPLTRPAPKANFSAGMPPDKSPALARPRPTPAFKANTSVGMRGMPCLRFEYLGLPRFQRRRCGSGEASLVSRISGDWGGRSWDAGSGGPGRARTKVEKVKTNNNA